MDQEKINKQIAYLRSQKDNPTGNYRQYLVNIYNLYSDGAKANGTDWCPNIPVSKLVKAAYAGIKEDHLSWSMVQRWKDDLKELGYIYDCKVNGKWRTYILKDLDF